MKYYKLLQDLSCLGINQSLVNAIRGEEILNIIENPNEYSITNHGNLILSFHNNSDDTITKITIFDNKNLCIISRQLSDKKIGNIYLGQSIKILISHLNDQTKIEREICKLNSNDTYSNDEILVEFTYTRITKLYESQEIINHEHKTLPCYIDNQGNLTLHPFNEISKKKLVKVFGFDVKDYQKTKYHKSHK